VEGNYLPVKRRRFTLDPALGKTFRRLVKGESKLQKPPEKGISRICLITSSHQVSLSAGR
jgi:hypothetical protein